MVEALDKAIRLGEAQGAHAMVHMQVYNRASEFLRHGSFLAREEVSCHR